MGRTDLRWGMIWHKANRRWIAAVLLLALVASSRVGDAGVVACLETGSPIVYATCKASHKCCCGKNDAAGVCGCLRPEKPTPPVPALPQESSTSMKWLPSSPPIAVVEPILVGDDLRAAFYRTRQRPSPRSLHATLCVWRS